MGCRVRSGIHLPGGWIEVLNGPACALWTDVLGSNSRAGPGLTGLCAPSEARPRGYGKQITCRACVTPKMSSRWHNVARDGPGGAVRAGVGLGRDLSRPGKLGSPQLWGVRSVQGAAAGQAWPGVD